jgi:hypothetical protein
LGWNAVPPESGISPAYGQVTLEQQGRYTAIAYQRLQEEWPWLGVGFYWFFKQADDRERDSNPQYYFRMFEPDFTPLPVYEALKAKTSETPVMCRGWHQAQHWAIDYQGSWQPMLDREATFDDVLSGQTGDTATFTFEGTGLDLLAVGQGRLRVQLDQAEPMEIELKADPPHSKYRIANSLPGGVHQFSLEVLDGPALIDGFLIEDRPGLLLNRTGSALMVVAAAIGLWALWKHKCET